MYNFDKTVIRRNSNCMKWDETELQDIIPLWVADMDFEAAPAIREALQRRIDHGVFGYSFVPETYYDAIISWFESRHQWEIKREWIQYTTGVVPAISAVLKALTMPGERVLVLTPVYNCFFSSIRNNGCEVLESKLKVVNCEDSLCTYEVDWADFEAKCAEEKTTVFLLCNPHNPAGRVWTHEELQQMNDICQKHQVRIVSDEIHCELIMPGYKYIPFGTIVPSTEKSSNGNKPISSENLSGERLLPVICTSPSKSFNTAGLQIANIICADAETRRRIDRAININEICDVNPFGPVALEAAYNESESWIEELNQYLWENYQALLTFFAEQLPQLKVFRLEGTYLVWVDITALGLSADELEEKLLRDAHVWVNSGSMYGAEGFIRINIATQRARLTEGLSRIAKSLNGKSQ
ncbi:MAG: pyridoxal phosphate-dependent aminotransferase [Prevotella sp.]|nr:pyridoxal phosphate-dependent aminotransferase [Prevotella sp.]